MATYYPTKTYDRVRPPNQVISFPPKIQNLTGGLSFVGLKGPIITKKRFSRNVLRLNPSPTYYTFKVKFPSALLSATNNYYLAEIADYSRGFISLPHATLNIFYNNSPGSHQWDFNWQPNNLLTGTDFLVTQTLTADQWYQIDIFADSSSGTIACKIDGSLVQTIPTTNFKFSPGTFSLDSGVDVDGSITWNIKDVYIGASGYGSGEIFSPVYVNGSTISPPFSTDQGAFSVSGGVITVTGSTNFFGAEWFFQGGVLSKVTKKVFSGLLNPFAQADLPTTNLVSRFRADSIVANDNDGLSVWNDSFGSNNLTVVDSSKKPVYKTNVLNGKPVVRFSGVATTAFAGTISVNQPFTIVVVGKQTSKTDAARFLDNTGAPRSLLGLNTSGFFDMYSGSASLNDSTDHSGAFHIFTAIYNGSFSTGSLDGNVVVSGNPGTNGIGPVIIGSDGFSDLADLIGDIAEILIYSSSLTPGSKLAIESYLFNKYFASGGWVPGLAKSLTRPITSVMSFLEGTADSYSESNADTDVALFGTNGFAGQSFTGNGSLVSQTVFYGRSVGSLLPTSLVSKIYAHSGVFGTSSVPIGSALATSDIISTAAIPASNGLIPFNFSNKVLLQAGTKYFVSIELPGAVGDASNNITVRCDGSSPTHPGNFAKTVSTFWTVDATKDLCFYVNSGPWSVLTKKTSRLFTAAWNSIGNLATSLSHAGGTAYTQAVAGTLSFVGTFIRTYPKLFTATLFPPAGVPLGTDNFNRVNNSTLGSNWGSVSTLNDFALSANTAEAATNANFANRYTAVSAPADQYSKCTLAVLNASTNTGVGAAVRIASGSATMYLIQGNTTETTMFKAVSGTYTQLGSTAAASAVNDVLEISAVGTTITGKKNGVVIIGPVTDGTIASGDFGIWTSLFGVSNLSLDNWEGGSASVGGAVGLLTKRTNKLLSAILSFIGAPVKRVAHTLAASVSFVGSLTKKTSRLLTAALSFIGSIATNFIHGGIAYFQSFTATLFQGSGVSGVMDSYSESNKDTSNTMGATSVQKFGQCFTGNGSQIIDSKWYLDRHTFPTGNAVSKIYVMTGTFGVNGNAGSLLATSDNVDVSTISTSFSLITFPFSGANQYVTTNGTHYVVSVEYSGGDGANYIEMGYDSSSGTHPGTWAFDTGSGWTAADLGDDLCFYVDGVSSGPVGLLTKQTNKLLSAILSFIGNIPRFLRHTFPATLSFIGTFIRTFPRTLTATLFQTGGAPTLIDSYSETNRNTDELVDSASVNNSGIGQSFTATGATLGSVQFYMSKVGSPTGNGQATLYSHIGTYGSTGSCNVLLATGDNFNVATLTGTPTLTSLTFSGANQFSLVNGTKYCICFEYTGGSSGNSVQIGVDSTGPTAAGNLVFRDAADPGWLFYAPEDACFYVYSTGSGAVGLLTKKTNKLLSAILSFVGTSIRRTVHALAASVSFIGSFTKNTIRLLTAALGFIGSIATQLIHGAQTYFQSVAGTLSFVGSDAFRTFRTAIASLSFIGAQTKQTSKTSTGTLSFIGTFIRSSRRTFTASLGFIGSLIRSLPRTLAGALSFTGAISKRTGKALLGSLPFIGSLLESIRKLLTAALTFVGTLLRSFRFVRSSFTGLVSFIGSMRGIGGKLLAGTLSFAGTVNRKALRLLAATLDFVGNMATLLSHLGSHAITFPSTLNFISNLNQRTSRALASTLSFIGSMGKRLPKALTAALSFVGSLARSGTRSLTATLSFVGADAFKTLRSLAGSLTFVGSQARYVRKALAAALSFIGSITRSAARRLTAALSFIGVFSRTLLKTQLMTGAISFIGALTTKELYGRILTATLNFTGSVSRRTSRTLAAALSFVGNLGRGIPQRLAATLSFAGNLAKQAVKSFSGLVSFIGSLAFTAAKAFVFVATLAFSGQVRKSTARTIEASLSFVADCFRSIPKAFTATLTFVGTLLGHAGVAFEMAFSATVSFTGSLIRRIGQVIKIGVARVIQAIQVALFKDTIAIDVALPKPTDEVKIQVQEDTQDINVSTTGNPSEIEITVPGDIDN